MSSPIAKQDKGFLDKLLIALHRRLSHSKRVDILSSLFSGIIDSMNTGNSIIRLLDIGCGDRTLSLSLESKNKRVKTTSIDIYPNSEGWDNYFQFDGRNIPFSDMEFDFTLFSDVLHHDPDNVRSLLLEARRVSGIILIKDHFEYGLWSRKILQLADIIGNYGYGVSIPGNYFTRDSFPAVLTECGLSEIKQICPLDIHSQLPVKLLFKSKYQFISIIH